MQPIYTEFPWHCGSKPFFPDHAVLIGDNNTGKSTVLEALDLVLGPDRAHRLPPVDEHVFYQGKYLGKQPDVTEVNEQDEDNDAGAEDTAPVIRIDATICDLTEDQRVRFFANIEWWDDFFLISAGTADRR